MKRLSGILCALVLCVACVPRPSAQLPVWRESVVASIRANSVAITVFYTLTAEEYQRQIKEPKSIFMSDQIGSPENKIIGRIGAGTLIGDNYILTVRHLFIQDTGVVERTIWVMFCDDDHPIQADVVVLSKGEKDYDDYALIKLREPVPGIGVPIANRSPETGEDVAFVGSLKRSAFFIRFLRVTRFQQQFTIDDAGALHLSNREEFAFTCVYPSGPGDSGGGVFNTRGELVGILYFGRTLDMETFVFSNPIEMARTFLIANGQEALLK